MLDLPTQAAPMQYGWRCGHHQCHARVLPTTHHPIFKTGHGAQGLATQAATLFNATLGVLPKHTGLQFGISRNAVRGIYSNFYRFIESHVERKQTDISFGSGDQDQWREVEADEVTVGKRADAEAPETRVTWDNFLGLVERGRPDSLVLVELPARSTSKRSPGPGPITKQVWKPLAERWVQGRNIILHTDSAKAYNLSVPGVVHTRVVHQKKKIAGKWVLPRYVVLERLDLGNDAPVYVKKGTQIIDGWWRILRKHLRLTNPKTKAGVRQAVRVAQWRSWHQGEDLWAVLGECLRL